jgi:hypothetical protein
MYPCSCSAVKSASMPGPAASGKHPAVSKVSLRWAHATLLTPRMNRQSPTDFQPAPVAAPAGPQLCLLGPPHLVLASEHRVELPDTLPGYLIAYLGHQQAWVLRESLSALLWPSAAPAETQSARQPDARAGLAGPGRLGLGLAC